MAEHNEIGRIGEDITMKFLVKHGFKVIERNYRTNYGEIDIIAKSNDSYRFVEVKSIKVFDFNSISTLKIRPEENLTKEKWRKLLVSIKLYLQNKEIRKRWQVDLACVYINIDKREGMVKLLENIYVD